MYFQMQWLLTLLFAIYRSWLEANEYKCHCMQRHTVCKIQCLGFHGHEITASQKAWSAPHYRATHFCKLSSYTFSYEARGRIYLSHYHCPKTHLLQTSLRQSCNSAPPMSLPFLGGMATSQLVHFSPNQAVWVWPLTRGIVLCSWARQFTLTVPLSTQALSV